MPFVAPWSKVTCPYCFERFHPRKAPWRDSTGTKVPDPEYAKFFGMGNPPSLAPIVNPKGGLGSRFYVSQPANHERLLCPKCHLPLPDKVSSGEAGHEVIAIIGARNSGKSNFFGVLMRQLRRRYTEEVGFDLLEADSHGPNGRLSTGDLYQARYGKYLFDPAKPKVIPQTVTAGGTRVDAEDPRIPLIYMLRFRKRGLQHITRPLTHRVPVYFMLYDAAGEDMVNADVLEQSYRFILRATGIVFLIDPFDYPGVRELLPDSIKSKLPPPMPEPARVVNQVINLYQSRRRLAAGGKLDVPVAFTLTKSDLLSQAAGLVDPTSPINKDGLHTRGYDKPGCEALHAEIVERIRRWDSGELIQLANSFFTRHQFFALSALGAMPNQDKTLAKEITPTRIADPLLWLLHERGYLPAVGG